MSHVMRPAEAAAYLSLSRQRLAKLRLTGGGPAYSKAGRSILYTQADLNEWLAANRRVSTSDKGASAAA